MKKAVIYIVPVLVCFCVGALAGLVQAESIAEWYPTLLKPPLTPPNIVFPIAWSIIYLCMGLSLGVLIHRGGERYIKIWIFQLVLNFLWSILFFYFRSPLLGLIDIVLLDLAVVWYIVAAGRRSRAAAWLFVPYLAWILFATYLNAYICVCNP